MSTAGRPRRKVWLAGRGLTSTHDILRAHYDGLIDELLLASEIDDEPIPPGARERALCASDQLTRRLPRPGRDALEARLREGPHAAACRTGPRS